MGRVPHFRREADKVGNFRDGENPNTLPTLNYRSWAGGPCIKPAPKAGCPIHRR